MADSTPTQTLSNDVESCFFQRTVTLYDWWLIKARNDFQGKSLAIAGVSSRKDEAMRVFVSAPIIKRYDAFSLETVDGRYVIISGFINERRTLENGFDPQVFNRFLFGFPPDWESYALGFSREESTTGTDLGGAFSKNVSASRPEILSDIAVAENCIPTTLVSPEQAPEDHGKLFPRYDCNVSKGIDGVNLVCSGGGKRTSARLHDIKVCLQKKQAASGGMLKRPDSEENSASVAFENCDVEGWRSPATPIPSQSRSEYSIDGCVENCNPTFLESPEKAQGDHEKTENECNVSKEVGGADVACSIGGKRRSLRLHDVKVNQQKKQSASGLPPKHSNNKNYTSVALDNCDIVGPESLATPIQSQSWRQLRTSSEEIVKKSSSRICRTSSPKTEGCYKEKRGRRKGVLNKSASAVKNLRKKDQSHLTKGSQQQRSTVSPMSSSFRTSRSGRLLLPPLEFWRNQIPIYNADHELKEIQDGASLISPCRGSSPSLSRYIS
ncbi:unnamed protein product [Sphenostylis stenocarpa]|uniref:SANTA domain-containing protein n=1 Tax=Sphenostylis stenocarpa TaxID=92480 RepID=A0AA86SNW3_9FABA|nr:unnamed protein product [Sphenostylis stenocarpa]